MSVDIGENDTVKDLFHEICLERNCGNIELTLHGKVLETDRKLCDYEIDEGTVLHASEFCSI